MLQQQNSKSAFERAQKVIPGGVNSPVRAFRSVGGDPIYIASASGSWVEDIDGNRYLDFLASWGPLLHGHAHPRIVAAVTEAAHKGTSFGAPTERETELAEKLATMFPSIDQVRLVSSGTEATMSAVRLARGATGRDLIVKFEGCYHGHGDSFLIAAGSGATTLGVPNSPGVTAGTASDTLLARYNDTDSVQALFDSHGSRIAAVIVEPVAGNMGVVPPAEGFLQFLRSITTKHGSVLIFDEVITGFRLARGGAQELFGVTPDLTTLGKIIGGGLPVGAYGGRADLMQQLAPTGPVYQAGTLSGNPLAVAAGLAMIQLIEEMPDLYGMLESKAARLEAGINDAIQRTGAPAIVNRVGSMMTMFFTDRSQVTNYEDAQGCDTARYGRFFRAALEKGVYLAPAQFEAAFVSSSHSDDEIEMAVSRLSGSLEKAVH